MNNSLRRCSGVLGVALLLSGCTPVGMAVGGAASLGVAAAQEGGVRTAVTDSAIQLKITDLWLKHDFDLYRKLSLTVKEGRVLVTGAVPNPDMRVEAIRLAWQADGVRQVLNEIMVENGAGITGTVSDGWISSNIKTRLLLDKYIESINYNIDTANGTVYLMGVAQDQKELDRVIDYARNTNRVANVVSYVRLRYQNPVGTLNPAVN
ncbi:MAG: BON domain-containing protein [Alphaproteobacteria bacterium]|nr:BON domain-containing protein [Alphaproteobacteria bacterium]